MMLTHIVIKKMPCNICCIHQVLYDGEPTVSVTTLRPKATGKVGQIRSREGRLRGRKNRRCRNRTRGGRLTTLFLSGHHLYLESIPLPTQPKHATMSESGYSEIVEPSSPDGAAITPRG